MVLLLALRGRHLLSDMEQLSRRLVALKPHTLIEFSVCSKPALFSYFSSLRNSLGLSFPFQGRGWGWGGVNMGAQRRRCRNFKANQLCLRKSITPAMSRFALNQFTKL